MRPHVHVVLGDSEASIALDDFEVLAYKDMSAKELRGFVREIMDQQANLLAIWEDIHG